MVLMVFVQDALDAKDLLAVLAKSFDAFADVLGARNINRFGILLCVVERGFTHVWLMFVAV